jgi:hypothetical protein
MSAILIVALGFCSVGCEKYPEGLSEHVNNPNERVAELGPATARIISPSSGDKVSSVFDYEIELRNPDETKFYYIANRIGGLCWPKARIRPESGVTIYKGESNEGGNPPGGRFSFVLIEVDSAMHESISRWLSGNDFAGIRIDGRKLASVDVVLRN